MTKTRNSEVVPDGIEKSTEFNAPIERVWSQAVTKHLRVLENAGLVRIAREGRESRFTARPETVAVARDYLDQVSRRWDGALARPKAHVE